MRLFRRTDNWLFSDKQFPLALVNRFGLGLFAYVQTILLSRTITQRREIGTGLLDEAHRTGVKRKHAYPTWKSRLLSHLTSALSNAKTAASSTSLIKSSLIPRAVAASQ